MNHSLFRFSLVVLLSLVLTLSLQMTLPVHSHIQSGIEIEYAEDCSNSDESSQWMAYKRSKFQYTLTESKKDLVCTIRSADKAFKNYEIEQIQSNGIREIQARLNQLSLTLDFIQWLVQVRNSLLEEDYLIGESQQKYIIYKTLNEGWEADTSWNDRAREQLQDLPLLEATLLSSGENMEPNVQAIYSQLNYGRNLLKLKTLNLVFDVAEDSFMDLERLFKSSQELVSWKSIGQLYGKALSASEHLGDKKAAAYAYGYYGDFQKVLAKYSSETTAEVQCPLADDSRVPRSYYLDCAKKLTEAALRISESRLATAPVGSSDELEWQNISLKWQWQIGQIYEALGEDALARDTFGLAVNTAESIRKKLLSANRDEQFLIRDESEPIYRDYIDELLSNSESSLESNQVELQEASHTIDLVQLGELENLLDCPLESIRDVEEVSGSDPNVATVRTFILDDRVETIWKFPGEERLYSYHYPIDRNSLRKDLKLLKNELQKPYFSSLRGMRLAQEVYDWLVRPAQDKLNSINPETLVFILDGPLRSIPMAVLYDGSGFLIEKYAVATALGGLELPQDAPDKNYQVLLGGASEGFDDFGDLPFVREEIRDIKSVFSDAEELLDEQLTSEALTAAIESNNYNVVHLAVHGEFGFERNETRLLFSASNEIKFNELEKIFRSRRRQPIELLVLSACETAEGSDRDVLGIAGMTVQTGSNSTLATLWSVNDLSTAELMKEFYRQLEDSDLSKAEALRKAQLHLLKDFPGRYNPSDWSPYVLVGDWR